MIDERAAELTLPLTANRVLALLGPGALGSLKAAADVRFVETGFTIHNAGDPIEFSAFH